jgi:PAS domain S-box-containing protein
MEEDLDEFLQRVGALEREVSRRKKLEEKLGAAEEWYETLARLSPVGIFRTDAEGNCLYVNRRWCEIAGLTPEEARGEGWSRGLHPEDREWVATEWYDAAKKNRPFHSEYRFQSSDGVTTWVIGDARAVRGPAGQLLGYVGTITDITERKKADAALRESQERLRAALGHMPVMLDAFDVEGNICVWNRECERVTGYGADEIIGNPKTMEMLYPDPAYRTRMMEAWAKRGDDYYDWEWDLTARGGTVKTVAWSNISKRFPIPGWATWGVGVDVTARKRAEWALRARVKELTCLYSLTRILNTPDISDEAMLQEAVRLLPPTFQYPEAACGRIVFENREHVTFGFEETGWKLASDITVGGQPAGRVEVCYLSERRGLTEGPFLREERCLIEEVAARLGEAMERKGRRRE